MHLCAFASKTRLRCANLLRDAISLLTFAGCTLWMHFSNSACALQREILFYFLHLVVCSIAFFYIPLLLCQSVLRCIFRRVVPAHRHCNDVFRYLLHWGGASSSFRHFRLQTHARGDFAPIFSSIIRFSASSSLFVSPCISQEGNKKLFLRRG
jgi:hypothetical protein